MTRAGLLAVVGLFALLFLPGAVVTQPLISVSSATVTNSPLMVDFIILFKTDNPRIDVGSFHISMQKCGWESVRE